MKKILALILAAVMLLCMSACGDAAAPEETTQPAAQDDTATQADMDKLESLYTGREAYHGELHDHADTGGTSDGKNTLRQWKENMLYVKDMDFAAIVDHRQVLHMRLEEWDNTMFIGGTEAGTHILDTKATQDSVHYNMIFAEPERLENVLNAYPAQFQYLNDHFTYPKWTETEMAQLIAIVNENGGFFVHVHPLGDKYMLSDDPLDYVFADYTGFEVLCGYYGNMSAKDNQEAYDYWKQILAAGRKVYATSGSDSHRLSNTVSLSTIYSQAKDAKAYLEHIRAGDFTAGPAGIRMCMGDTKMGGETGFAGQRLVVSVGDFHSIEYDPTHTYRIDVYNEKGLVMSQEITGQDKTYVAMDADPACMFYRAEVYDVTADYIFALGNPIWNTQVS